MTTWLQWLGSLFGARFFTGRIIRALLGLGFFLGLGFLLGLGFGFFGTVLKLSVKHDRLGDGKGLNIGIKIVDAVAPEGVLLVVVAIALSVLAGFISLAVLTVLVSAKALLVPLQAGVFVAFGLAGLEAGFAVSELDVWLPVGKVALRLVLPASHEGRLEFLDRLDVYRLLDFVGGGGSASVGHADRVASAVLLGFSVGSLDGAVVALLLALDPSEADAFLVLGAELEALLVSQVALDSAHQSTCVVIAAGVINVLLSLAWVSQWGCGGGRCLSGRSFRGCRWCFRGCRWCFRGCGRSGRGRSGRGRGDVISTRHVVDALVPVSEVPGSTLAIALVALSVLSKFVAAKALVVPLETGEFVSCSLAFGEARLSVSNLEVGLSVGKITPFLVLVASDVLRFGSWLERRRSVDRQEFLLGLIPLRDFFFRSDRRLLRVSCVNVFPAGEFAPERNASIPAGFVQVVPPAVGFIPDDGG